MSYVMAMMTISVTTEAYEALKRLKTEDQSFSDVIVQNLPRSKPRTAGELLDELERDLSGATILEPSRVRLIREGRERRSNRRNVPGR